jgi:hypothetical protein
MFAGGALVLVIAAPAFARSANGVATATGLGATFIGTWLVGFSTSLPELVTCLAAVRLRAYDLAVGNLFGSNAFNMAVFPLLDAVSPTGPVFGAITATHAISALVAIGLMGIALAALVYRARGRISLLEPSSALILVGYVLGLALVLRFSATTVANRQPCIGRACINRSGSVPARSTLSAVLPRTNRAAPCRCVHIAIRSACTSLATVRMPRAAESLTCTRDSTRKPVAASRATWVSR